jgi:hypothetical protein
MNSGTLDGQLSRNTDGVDVFGDRRVVDTGSLLAREIRAAGIKRAVV